MTSIVIPRLSPGWALSIGIPIAGLLSLVIGAAAAWGPLLCLAGLVALVLGIVVWNRPAVAAYLVIGVTPLVAGIDRGAVLPLLRPNEAIDGFVLTILLVRILVRREGERGLSIHLRPVEKALLAMAVTSSVLPIAWLVIRSLPVAGVDVSYALVLWKYLAVYLVVRLAVRNTREIHHCLQVSVAVGTAVGVIGILQVLDVFGVRALLDDWYLPVGHIGRAGSTLALPAATADLLIFNLAIAVGLCLTRSTRHRVLHLSAAGVFVVGTFAAAEFSSALGLLVALVCVAFALRVPAILGWAALATPMAIVVMWPVVSDRLQGFEGLHGLPTSWLGRLHNLQTYFWPELFSGPNFLLGVRPSARVPVSGEVTGYVWIESGYTWLFWGGGIPLFLAFVYFVVTTVRLTLTTIRTSSTVVQTAALAAFTAIWVIAALMVFDPHLTYRGSADCFFGLLALTTVGARAKPPGAHQQTKGVNSHVY